MGRIEEAVVVFLVLFLLLCHDVTLNQPVLDLFLSVHMIQICAFDKVVTT